MLINYYNLKLNEIPIYNLYYTINYHTWVFYFADNYIDVQFNNVWNKNNIIIKYHRCYE